MMAQIRADVPGDEGMVGSKINIFNGAMYYHNKEDTESEDYRPDDPVHEIATVGDIEEALPEPIPKSVIDAICSE